MWYYGKKRDTFAYSIEILFAERGYERIPFLDCISGRAFCMECKKNVKWWFETAVPVPQAVENINSCIFGSEDIIKCAENTELSTEEFQRLLQEGCVIGPVRETTSIAHLQDRFYQGNQQYFYVKYDGDSCIGITDPLGVPLYFEEADDVDKVLKWGDFVIWMPPWKTTVQSIDVDWEEVLVNGFSCYKMHSGEPNSIEKYNFSAYYQSCSSAHTSLHMALNHYLRQMTEIANLLDALCKDTLFRRNFRDLFSKVSEVKYTEDLETFQTINNQIWELFYERFRVYKIDGFRHKSFEL